MINHSTNFFLQTHVLINFQFTFSKSHDLRQTPWHVTASLADVVQFAWILHLSAIILQYFARTLQINGVDFLTPKSRRLWHRPLYELTAYSVLASVPEKVICELLSFQPSTVFRLLNTCFVNVTIERRLWQLHNHIHAAIGRSAWAL